MEVPMKRRFPVIAVLSYFRSSSAGRRGQTAKKPLTLEEMISLKSVGTVALSPSGQMVAFDVTSVDWPRNTFTSDVWLADTAGRQCFAVTKGPDMNMAAAWSPDGQALTFLSTRRGKPQLFIFRPGRGEAEPLIEAPNGVRKYAWSPDGKSIAFLTSETPDQDKTKAKERGVRRRGHRRRESARAAAPLRCGGQNLEASRGRRFPHHGIFLVPGRLQDRLRDLAEEPRARDLGLRRRCVSSTATEAG